MCSDATGEVAAAAASGYVFFRLRPCCYGVSFVAVVEFVKFVSGAWLAVVLLVDGGVGLCEVSTMLELCNSASGCWKADPVPFSDEIGLLQRIQDPGSTGKIPGRRATKTWASAFALALFIDSESPWAMVHSGSDGSPVLLVVFRW